MENQPSPRKISFSLYLTAFFISAIIFAFGVYVGTLVQNDNLQAISQDISAANQKMGSVQLLYLFGDSPDLCPVYLSELYSIDAQTEQLGYKIAFLEDKKDAYDPELKKSYFLLESSAYLLSQKVREKCEANYSTVLYFYSNARCQDCRQQGNELLAVKKKLGEGIRIYSFDGDLGSPIVDALKKRYGVSGYPSLVVNSNLTVKGLKSQGWIEGSLQN